MNLILRVHQIAGSLSRKVLTVAANLTITGYITGSLTNRVHVQTSNLSLLADNNRNLEDLVFRVNILTGADFDPVDFAAADFLTV